VGVGGDASPAGWLAVVASAGMPLCANQYGGSTVEGHKSRAVDVHYAVAAMRPEYFGGVV
jgi:hypothetical protein